MFFSIFQETKTEVLNKNSKFKTLLGEGESLATSDHMLEEPDKHDQVVGFVKDLKDKWNDIADKLKDSTRR